jgi:hypothetical protein
MFATHAKINGTPLAPPLSQRYSSSGNFAIRSKPNTDNAALESKMGDRDFHLQRAERLIAHLSGGDKSASFGITGNASSIPGTQEAISQCPELNAPSRVTPASHTRSNTGKTNFAVLYPSKENIEKPLTQNWVPCAEEYR